MRILIVKDLAQLDVLSTQESDSNGLHFSFSVKYLDWLKSLLSKNHAYQIILEDDGDFVGYLASAETLWDNHLTIIEVFVSPKFQGKGIGKKLISYAFEFAKEKNLEGLIVQTENENIPAQKLYEKFGFEKFENVDWEGLSYKFIL